MTRLALVYAVAAAAWTAARFTPIGTLRLFDLADLFAWALFLPAFALIGVALVTRRWRAAAFLLVPAVLFAAEYAPVFVPRSAPEGAVSLRVATANLYLFNQEVDAVVEVLEELDADVVALHELSGSMADAVSTRLRGRYPHRLLHPRTDAFGMGLVSRLPLREVHPPRLGREACSCHEAVVELGGREVRIVNAHPLPPGHSLRSFDARRQATTFQTIVERVGEVDGPLVLLGDFNVGDRHRFYRDIRRHLGDAHRDAGLGFGFTWPAARPLLRIDYVFRSEHFGARESSTGPVPGSDHRYVFADLVLLGS